MNPSPKALELVKHFEGCRLEAYRDSAGILTIGYGHTGPDVHEGQQIMPAQAEYLLAQDLGKAAQAVNALGAPEMTQMEFDALVSFVFNVGAASFHGSSLAAYVRQGQFASAAAEFPKWCHAHVNGKLVELPGLVRRRAAEQALFQSMP